ncbi:hypothetical protein PG984_008286 [Apiospora sp. TS-2023a]
MAAPTCNIPREDWENHRATILELYCDKGLPLTRRSDSKEKDQCVEWVMRCQYGFTASQSQYEAQLKKWGVAKNLKRDEWISLLAKHDRLESQGREVRVVISGKVQAKERVRKARHRYARSSAAGAHGSSQGVALAPSRQAFVEIKESGVWKRWSSDHLPATSSALVPILGPHQSSASTPPEAMPGHSTSIALPRRSAISPRSPDVSPITFPAPSPEGYSFGIGLFNQTFSSPDFDVNPFDPGLEIVEIDTSNHSAFGAGLDFLGAGISPRVLRNDIIWNDDIWPNFTTHSIRSSHESPDAVPHPPRRDSAELEQSLSSLLRGESVNATVRGSVLGIAEHFQSLVSADSIFWQTYCSSTAVGTAFSVDNAHFATLLYSILNGFAGLDGDSQTSILRILDRNAGYLNHLLHILRNGPDSIAKQLADSLFRAAVVSNDARTVSLLLDVTRYRSSITIDVNEFPCMDSRGPVNPIVLAVRSGNEELTRILLEAGADPLKVRPNGAPAQLWHMPPALEIMLERTDLTQTTKLRLSSLLISHGAEITSEAVAIAVRRATDELTILKALIERLPADRHMIMFQDRYNRPGAVVEHIVEHIENSVATSLVKKLVDDCNSTKCGKCVSNNSRQMDRMLKYAARRGNIELAELFAPYATSLSDALAGAVRSGKMELVRFLVDRGARADGQACKLGSTIDDVDTTPLAEAISLENSEMINIVQEYGAWAYIDCEEHFVLATLAAAKVGSIPYLEMILRRAQPKTRAELVTFLFKAGANDSHLGYGNHEPLRHALKKRNMQIFEALVESYNRVYDAVENSRPRDFYRPHWEGSVMELASEWGDMNIIADLSCLGIPLDEGYHRTPLAVAVVSRNFRLVEYLLKYGVDPSTKAMSGCTPLSAAVEIRDYAMIKYLLSNGATPVDVRAFTKALKFDMTALLELRSAFIMKHPLGLKGFGGVLIMNAMEADNGLQIDSLLDMKVDLNSMESWIGYKLENLEDTGLANDLTDDLHQKGLLGKMSPLGFAILYSKGQNLELVRQLLNAGAQPDSVANGGVTSLRSSGDLRGRFDLQRKLNSLRTPLLLAVETGRIELVGILLQRGADINRPARRGVIRTPLQEACELGSYSMVEYLLRHGAQVNSPPARQDGGTALQLAAKSGSMKITELLLQLGAEIHAPGPEFRGGYTAFEWAAEKGRYHILLLLWNASRRDGFTTEVLSSACNLAQENGHRGCVDIITSMMHDSSFGRLISFDAEGVGIEGLLAFTVLYFRLDHSTNLNRAYTLPELVHAREDPQV